MGQNIATDPPLRALAAERDVLIGVAVSTGAFKDARAGDDESPYLDLIAEQFSIITPENAGKFGPLSTGPGEFDFTTLDAMVDWAREHRLRVRLHSSLWHWQVPGWLEKGDWTNEQIEQHARQYLTAIGERYAGRFEYWDVVNEPLDMKQDDGLRRNLWYEAMGPGYLAKAYRWAHEAAPDARLVINDYGMWHGGAKADRMYQLVRELRDQGVPVHAVGFQCHLLGGEMPQIEQVVANFRRFADLGIEVHITEMDVATSSYGEMPMQQQLERQAEVYRRMLTAALQVEQFTVFQTWGYTDRHTWVRGFLERPEDQPLLYDEQYQPKPAYEAIREVLRRAGESSD